MMSSDGDKSSAFLLAQPGHPKRQRIRIREKRVDREKLLVAAVAAGSGSLLLMQNFFKFLSIASEEEIKYVGRAAEVEPQIKKEDCMEIVCRMMTIFGKVKTISISLNKNPYLDGSVFVEFYDAAAARKAFEVYNKTTLTNLKKDEFLYIIAPSCSWWFYKLDLVVNLCKAESMMTYDFMTRKLLHDIACTKRWIDVMKTHITMKVFPFDSLPQLTCKKRGCEGGKGCNSLHLENTKEMYRKCSFDKERKKVIEDLEDIRSFHGKMKIQPWLKSTNKLKLPLELMGQRRLENMWTNWKTWKSGVNE